MYCIVASSRPGYSSILDCASNRGVLLLASLGYVSTYSKHLYSYCTFGNIAWYSHFFCYKVSKLNCLKKTMEETNKLIKTKLMILQSEDMDEKK